MAGNGPAPKEGARRRRNPPLRGEWKATPGFGWQHGAIPVPVIPLQPATLDAWFKWMRSWFAAHWTPDDLPGLTIVVGLYDQVLDYLREPLIEKEYVTTKGATRTVWVAKPNPSPELRQLMDNYGISPKGQQDRRWTAPKPDEQPAATATPAAKRYGHLRAVSG